MDREREREREREEEEEEGRREKKIMCEFEKQDND